MALNEAKAFLMQIPTVRSSFKQGITAETRIGSAKTAALGVDSLVAAVVMTLEGC
jgi:hypothetical protein